MVQVKEFFDQPTFTLTYVIWNQNTRDAVIIDPLLDYDQGSSKISEKSVHEVLDFVQKNNLNLHYVLETHAHADHLSGSQIIKREFPNIKIGIGSEIVKVQKIFKSIFALPNWFKTDGSQFDKLFFDGEILNAGELEIKTIFTPGHTPACVSYLVEDEALFTGDALFMPDYGTGRCDFPGGSSDALYTSVHDKLYSLPDSVGVYTCHDYLPGGRALKFQSTIGEEKRLNVQLNSKTSRVDFIRFREDRDKTLAAPKLLLPSVQINIDAGRLPPNEPNGKSYLKIPIGY